VFEVRESSFTSRDPRYARFRVQGTFGRQAAVLDVTVAQVRKMASVVSHTSGLAYLKLNKL
jgi:hypothetical protein